MYDPQTAALIRQTPELPGLDREDLPDVLSRAYAEIASARVMLRDGQPSLEQLSETIGFAQRLARTNEALILASPDRDDKAAAAFVAATAYQLVRQAEAIRKDTAGAAYLRGDAISPEISAMLLFLAAEASADAAEVSRHINFPEDEPLQANLIWTLIRLARGQVGAITDSRSLGRRRVVVGTDYQQAVAALYYQLLRGVRALAFRLQGRRITDMADPIAVFERVKSLASPTATDALGDLNAQALVAFSGPFHLASLLIILGRSLLDGAVVNLPAPDATDPARWRKAMQGVAANRREQARDRCDALYLDDRADRPECRLSPAFGHDEKHRGACWMD